MPRLSVTIHPVELAMCLPSPALPTIGWLSLWLLTASLSVPQPVASQETPIRFDVPALVLARPWQPLGPPAAAASEAAPATPMLTVAHRPAVSDEQIVEIVVPVTAEWQSHDAPHIDSFRIDVFWVRKSYPLVDYAPKTATVAEVDGTIAIEETDESNRGGGLNLSGKYESLLSANATAEAGTRNQVKTHYAEIPQHDILIASGTSHRGTGAFFRFHPSRRETLEGGRELVLAFRVPDHWRGGLLNVECRSEGKQSVVGSWKTDFEYARSFVVPVYLDGDRNARDAAVDLAQSEQQLRRQWQEDLQRQPPRNSTDLLAALIPRGKSVRASSGSGVPEQWIHLLIQSGDDAYLERFRSRLSEPMESAAERYVQARRLLWDLNR